MTTPTTPDILTTGQVATLVGVCKTAVQRWIDGDHLRGHRLPGNKKDRRVHRSDLIDFMVRHGMFRSLGEITAEVGGLRLPMLIYERWGQVVARVSATNHFSAGKDLLPGEGIGVIDARDEIVTALRDAGYRVAVNRS